MNEEFYTGRLMRWDDDRGFGFIVMGEGEREVFLHISGLKKIARRPLEGDLLCFQIYRHSDGRQRAINASIDGVDTRNSSVVDTPLRPPPQPQPAKSADNADKRREWPVHLLLLGVIVAAGIFGYKNVPDEVPAPAPAPASVPVAAVAAISVQAGGNSPYRCEGKLYCSEMSSCAEATFYQHNCSGTKMDGDGDGVPCERQWCGH